MVNTILFDFGDVFINKNNKAKQDALAALGVTQWNTALDNLEDHFERGAISEHDFLKGIQQYSNNASLNAIRDAWNAGIKDFPLKRLEFLQKLSHNYRLFLLSNTDTIHIEKFEDDAGPSFYGDFYRCFEKVYFSHEIGLRKPDYEAFRYVMNKHEIQPKRALVVDDKKQNTDAAAALGFQTWTLNPEKEDVTQLFKKKVLSLHEV
ncbi:HAD family hydrolase [Flavobacterium rhizosphaerae]|uniref:HAD family phosphatase n=1 Tax=Flavobacterium rhizosphaerae TaxID=3163298 RepID=A0ABW8YX01_9FLAO